MQYEIQTSIESFGITAILELSDQDKSRSASRSPLCDDLRVYRDPHALHLSILSLHFPLHDGVRGHEIALCPQEHCDIARSFDDGDVSDPS